MRRTNLFTLVVAALVFGLVTTAVAANVHLKNRPPLTFTDNGLTLQATGALTGLGNGDVVIELTAQGQPVATCTNPAGATQPPGQNPAVVDVGGVQEIPEGAIKNGNVAFNVSTTAPTTPIAGAPDCPNPRWTEAINDVIFSGFEATLTVFQGEGCSVAAPQNCVQVFTVTRTIS